MADEEISSSVASVADRPPPPKQMFPKFEEINRRLNFTHHSLQNTTHNYVVSASRDLVALLKALTCRQCEQKDERNNTFSADSPPYIAICGHYVHKDCRYVNRNPTKGLFFSCNRCSNQDTKKGRLPSEIAVFQDFYKKIEEKGFRCFACEEDENMHPRYNVVQITHLSHSDGTTAYMCVWCYAGKTYFQYCCGKVLDDKDDPPEEKPLSGGVSKKLSSVDSKLHCNQFINFQCCCCMKPLIKWLREPKDLKEEFDKPVKLNEDLEHLECGHIRHEDCKLHFKGSARPNDKRIWVHCHLCPGDWSVEDANEKSIVSQLKGYVKEDIGYSAFRCRLCYHFHPINNEARQTDKTKAHRICVWCMSELVMKHREERYIERSRRDTESTRTASSGVCSIS